MFRRQLRSLVVAQAVIMLVLALPLRSSAQIPAPDLASGFFDNNVLQDIYFTINSKDWDTLKVNYLDNTYYPVDFKWGTTTVRNSGIRSRGTGSRSGAKPGLRLDFDRYTADQKFLGLKSMVLRNSTQDASNMHEQLAMLLFRRMGQTASREVYARLFINNTYAGLYSIVESVDKTFLAANFGNDAGYLLKYDYNVEDPPYYFTYRSPNPGDYVPHPFKPETNENDPQPEVMERFAYTINNVGDATFRSAIAEFIDAAAWVRRIAARVFVADNDAFLGNWGMNNYYLYRLPTDHVFNFIHWDLSESFKDTPDYWIWHNHLDAPDPARNRLWARLMSYPDLKALYLDSLLETARVVSEIPAGVPGAPPDTRGWLEREVDRQFALINAAVQADPTKPYSNDQFLAAVNFVRDFVRQRPQFVRDQVSTSP